jgi:hypothetical protein
LTAVALADLPTTTVGIPAFLTATVAPPDVRLLVTYTWQATGHVMPTMAAESVSLLKTPQKWGP